MRTLASLGQVWGMSGGMMTAMGFLVSLTMASAIAFLAYEGGRLLGFS